MLLLSYGFVYLVSIVFWVALLAWLIGRFHLRGEDLSAFDSPAGEQFASAVPNPALQQVLVSLAGLAQRARSAPRARRTAVLREAMDQLGEGRDFDARFEVADCAGVPGEWVLVTGADPARRLLYIHGGAYIVGSPRSHRALTVRLAQLTGCAVLAIDYRLMPEHPRRAGIDDCRSAYRWLLDHGPEGAQPARTVFVAGDSAGGNLTLSLLAWVRDQGLRLPTAAVALSPATDSTLGSPSLKSNLATDYMLGPMFAAVAWVPRTVLLWGAWLQTRINPRDPIVSPVYGRLGDLPPVLVQASKTEMLRDDARRWVNRARAAGSPASLQVWDHMIHVWQLFYPELPEAGQALDEIARFLAAAEARDDGNQRLASASSRRSEGSGAS